MKTDSSRADTGRAVLGVQALQGTDSPERGIPRYILDYARALNRRAPAIIERFDLDPALTVGRADELEGRVGSSKVAPAGPGPTLYHVLAPFEPRPISSIWPEWARANGVKLVVTLYDLILLMWEKEYLASWPVKQGYMARLGLVRTADAVLAISQQTADDAVRLLGVDRRRIFVVHAGVSELFVPPTQPRERVLQRLQVRFPDLRPGFFLYAGASDHRKNLEALIRAYALLPKKLRRERQLVIVSKLPGVAGIPLQQLTGELGLEDDTLWTDYVPDETLVRLYQACGTFVFPSLYEGFGLPVVEAQRCGAPVLVGNNSSLREVVLDAEARFDAESPRAIAEAMKHVASDGDFRAELARRGQEWATRFTWDRVVDASLQAYQAVWNEAIAERGDAARARLEVVR